MLDFVSMEAEVKERPILFRSEMVQAYLASHKWQTRRIIKPQPVLGKPWGKSGWIIDPKQMDLPIAYCPYGVPGDILWAKETWRIVDRDFDPGEVRVGYKATPEPKSTDSRIYTQVWSPWIEVGNTYAEKFNRVTDRSRNKWRPSIFMPRWASRISFPIVSIRAEIVQEISKADCIAEGVYWSEAFPEGYTVGYPLPGYGLGFGSAEGCYKALWNIINAKRGYGWDMQPWWVWVIEFPKYEVVQ